jgi:glycosyltransferase involved in cell wall biosynthesis
MNEIPKYSVVLSQTGNQAAQVCVLISLYNYQNCIVEALSSVFKQTLTTIDLVIIDDLSKDDSRRVTLRWLLHHKARFNNISFCSHHRNSGLSTTRNTGFTLAQTPYVFVLDADNSIYPRCLATLLGAVTTGKAGFAYCIIERYNSGDGEPNEVPLMGVEPWLGKAGLTHGNYLDAMALISKAAWHQAGGYGMVKFGWEDYDLWCTFAELGVIGAHVPEILCRYRVHKTSMLNTMSRSNSARLINDMKAHHPWLELG